jgi:hypothetical protein
LRGPGLCGELWRLATQDADWSPTEPAELVGKSIEDAEIHEGARPIRSSLGADGACLRRGSLSDWRTDWRATGLGSCVKTCKNRKTPG